MSFMCQKLQCHQAHCNTSTLRQKNHTPQVGPTGVQTHDLKIMDSTFHVPEVLILTTEPSGTSLLPKFIICLCMFSSICICFPVSWRCYPRHLTAKPLTSRSNYQHKQYTVTQFSLHCLGCHNR